MKTPLVIAVIAVLALGAFVFWVIPHFGERQDTEQEGTLEEEAAVTIVRRPEGYEPKEVTIKQGDIVEWVNESGEFHWPASDLHPTHGVYPEFDPLRPLAQGEMWKFKFDKSGVWKYHDHIRANKTGTITVE